MGEPGRKKPNVSEPSAVRWGRGRRAAAGGREEPGVRPRAAGRGASPCPGPQPSGNELECLPASALPVLLQPT